MPMAVGIFGMVVVRPSVSLSVVCHGCMVT